MAAQKVVVSCSNLLDGQRGLEDGRRVNSPKLPMNAPQSTLHWLRFWCPLGGAIHCEAEGEGFLTDPADSDGRYANLDLRRLAELLPDTGPLLLCGEPGVHHPDGACALGRDGQPRWQGSVRLAPVDIVGMTGAGDAFAAGVLYGLHEDEPIETALRHGVCAAACLGATGCSDGVQPLAKCLELGRAHGYRP